jgi:tetratricopeptide (TPR) repeat protein
VSVIDPRSRFRTLGRTALLLAAVVGSSAAPTLAHGNVRHDFKLINGRWWNGRDFAPRTVFSVGGEFRDAYDGPVEATLDLAGAHVVPPLADAHNHGLAGFGDRQAAVSEALRLGIFYFENPNNLASFVQAARTAVNQPRSVDVIYANGGLTASGGHPAQIYDRVAPQIGKAPREMDGDAYVTVDDAAALSAKWPAILAAQPDLLKTYLVHSEEYPTRRDDPAFYGKRGLDPALLPEIVRRAHAAGLRVVTHAETAADFRAAVAAGVDQIAHLPLAPLTADDARAAAAAHTTVVTTTLGHWDTRAVADLDALHRDNLRALQGAGVTLAVGTDGPKTALDEIDNLRRLAAFDIATLLRIAFNDTARAIFPGRRVGCLEAGCEASFLALDGDPRTDPAALRHIRLRMKQGFKLDLKPTLASALAPLVEDGATGAAIVTRTRALLRESPEAYEVDEQQLNRIGYTLLAHGRAADAIEVFRANTEIYPASANAFDSLAEACEKSGDRDGARVASARVLALLQGDPHVPEGLRRGLEANARRRIGG